MCLAASFGLELFYIKQPNEDVVLEWSKHFVTALIIIALLEMAFQMYTLRHLEREWNGAIRSLFTDPPERLVGMFGGPQMSALIRASLVGATDQARGDLIYTHLLEPYLRDDRRFRFGFDYRVEVVSFAGDAEAARIWHRLIEGHPDAETVEQLNLVAQELSYSSPQGVANATGRVEVRLVFQRDELEQAFRDPGVFFREILSVEQATSKALRAAANRDLTGMLKGLFAFCAFDRNSRPLPWTADLGHSSVGDSVFVRILIDLQSAAGADFCRVRLHMPQSKSRPFLLMQVAEPTHDLSLWFKHHDPDVELADFSFFPPAVERKTFPIERNAVEFRAGDHWLFPRTGVLFTWQPRSRPAVAPTAAPASGRRA